MKTEIVFPIKCTTGPRFREFVRFLSTNFQNIRHGVGSDAHHLTGEVIAWPSLWMFLSTRPWPKPHLAVRFFTAEADYHVTYLITLAGPHPPPGHARLVARGVVTLPTIQRWNKNK